MAGSEGDLKKAKYGSPCRLKPARSRGWQPDLQVEEGGGSEFAGAEGITHGKSRIAGKYESVGYSRVRSVGMGVGVGLGVGTGLLV